MVSLTRRLGMVLVFGAVCLARPASTRAEWPTYLGGNDRAGWTAQRLDAPLHRQWRYAAPAKVETAWSGPRAAPIEGHEMRHRVDFDAALQVVMSKGRAYFASSVDFQVYCVDASTGAPQWRFSTEGPVRLAPTLDNGRLFVGSDDGQVYCLDASEGTLNWKRRIGPRDERILARGRMISRWPVRTGLLVDRGTVYCGAGVFPHELIFMAALDAATGDVVWQNGTISQQNAGRNDLSPQGYLLANDDLLFVPSGRSLPVAFDRATGALVHQRKHAWRTDAGGVVGGTKALLADGQVYAGGPHHFLAMNQATGEEGEAWVDGRQMAIVGEFAYVATGKEIRCLDRQAHWEASREKQKWFLAARRHRSDPAKRAEAQQKMEHFAGQGIIWSAPSTLDGALIACENLVVCGGPNRVVALDRETGQRVWEDEVEGVVRGLAISGGVLTASTDAGHIYAYAASPVAEVAELPESESTPFPADALSRFYQETARQILEQSGQRRGFCLVLGSEEGRLAYELARQSDLRVYGVEPDAEKAAAARQALERAGWHGTRVAIVSCPFDQIPFSNYFANLVVSDSWLLTGRPPCPPGLIARHLKPCGGVAMVGCPEGAPGAGRPVDASAEEWLENLFAQDTGEIARAGAWGLLRRGKLPGAGNWSHQYGNIANTSLSPDTRVRGGLGVLWYGDPGPSQMINRHEAAAAPLSTNGRMFIQGTDRVMCYDAYNGTFLWDYENPGAIRTGVFNNRETSNLAASDDDLYVAVGSKCLVLDAATGLRVREFETPPTRDGIPRAWAYVAYDDGVVYGTSTIRSELEQRLRRRGLTVKSQTDAVFAVDALTGDSIWTYRGDNILHTTIAVDAERMYFIDSSLTPEERQRLYQREKPELRELKGEALEKAKAEWKKRDLRLLVALEKRTGEKLWQKPVDVTDTTDISAGGGNLSIMCAEGRLVLCGANANGHYWRQFLSGEFDRRKLLVLDAKSGKRLWAKNANYMNRPLVVGQTVIAEPWAFDLETGEPKQRTHPLTGQPSDWRFSRPGHHCGVITATPNMMFFRSGFIGYYDLYQDSGTRHFAGQRLGCWINAIPGNGLVMIPEASAGCVCLFSIASTVVLEPRTESRSWGILSAVGPSTPVKRMCLNLGAPGERKDRAGDAWFGYPRPSSRGRLEFVFDVRPKFAPGGDWYAVRDTAEQGAGESRVPTWVLSSGARGLAACELPLLAENDPPAHYTLKLVFPGDAGAAAERFPLRVQGETRTPDRTEAIEGEAVVHTYAHVPVKDALRLELVYPDAVAPEQLPRIAAIEVICEEP